MRGLFQRGRDVLWTFLKDPNDPSRLPSNMNELRSLEKLLTLLLKSRELAGLLRTNTSSKGEPIGGAMSWTLRLAHHLLTELASDHHYMIDEHSRNPYGKPKDKCPCCDEPIALKDGYLGDTSLGNPNYWHGSVDILMGQVAAVTVKRERGDYTDGEDYSSDSSDNSDSSIEINVSNQEEFLTRPEEFQVIAETIVFSLIQKRRNKDCRFSLVPTIVIKNHNIYLYMYDGKYDVLLKTASHPLFSTTIPPPKLDITTIIALWLVINYKLFCTGITKEIKGKKFQANFLSSLNKEVRDAYEKILPLGRCRIGPPVERFQPRENDSVVEGTPDVEPV